MSNTQSKQCEMCHNPYPYICEECKQCLHDEQEMAALDMQYHFKDKPQSKKIYIGSGEDLDLELLQ